MSQHYNAFISYKHAPNDIKIAESIQRDLEHFHIPSKIKKKTGMKRIQRIFRDKDDLPMTSDLSVTISEALMNSDYLIVICSPEAKQSIWVDREIRFFLQSHTRNEILTVLTSGEPNESIPEILLYEDRYETLPDGSFNQVRTAVEPLSCDYRMPLKHARKTELPRLASALIGCSYDELMNRRRQYAIKRLTAAFAALLLLAAAFSGYMLYSRNKIRTNYLNSLRNHSKYLAAGSRNLLAAEQRISALELAIAALPHKENDETPVTPEALRALTDATLAYVPDNGTNITAAWNYSTPNHVKHFEVSPDGNSLTAVDDTGNLCSWNVYDHKEIMNIKSVNPAFNDFLYVADDTFIVWDSSSLYAYTASTGNLLWTYESGEGDLTRAKADTGADNSFYLLDGNEKLLNINTKDGSVIKTYELSSNDPFDIDRPNSTNFIVSPDNKKAAFITLSGFSDYRVNVIDFASGKVTSGEATTEHIKDVYWIDDNTLISATSINSFDSSMSFYNHSVLKTDHSILQCFEAGSLKEKWHYDFYCNDVMINSEFLRLPKTDSIAYYSGNIAVMLNKNTGEEMYLHNVNDSIIDISDNDGDGWPVYITYEGGYCIPSPNQGRDVLQRSEFFTNDICNAWINNGVYVQKKMSNEIIYYGLHLYDTDWKALSGVDTFTDSIDHYIDENVLCITTSGDKPSLTIIDLGDFKGVKKIELNKDITSSSRKILGSDDQFVYMAEVESNKIIFTSIDIFSGNVSSDTFETDIVDINNLGFNNGIFCYACTDAERNRIVTKYDVKSKESKSFTLDPESSFEYISPVISKDGGLIYVVCNNNEYIIDTESGSINKTELPEYYEVTQYISDFSNDGYILITDGNVVECIDKDGKIVLEIKCPGTPPTGMTFFDSKKEGRIILVPYDDGTLYRYSMKTGELLGITDYSIYSGYTYTSKFSVDPSGDNIYISTGPVTDTFETDSWYETACVENCFGVNVRSNRFLTYSSTSEGKSVGYFEHYDLEQLLEKGKKMLGGQELSDELKSQYGIDEDDDEK